MKRKILVLGSGRVGTAIACDLHDSGHEVVVIDLSPHEPEKLLKRSIRFIEGDFHNEHLLKREVKKVDLVVGASPGEFGYELMKKVIRLEKNMADISFCPENALELDSLAKDNNVTVLTDIGVAPGLCNLMLGYHDKTMKVESYKCMVGGLPLHREWPLEYKASWSPRDVIEEYTRPARLVENGKLITSPALSDLEKVTLSPVGELEAWNSDGLRTLIETMAHIPNMVEKTLRYPGTTKYLQALSKLGYFSDGTIRVNGLEIKPVDLSASLLMKHWELRPGEREFTIMKVEIAGIENNQPAKHSYQVYDEYDEKTQTSSMARTTGYTCSAGVNLLLQEKIQTKGVLPPERVGGEEGCFEFVVEYLRERGVEVDGFG